MEGSGSESQSMLSKSSSTGKKELPSNSHRSEEDKGVVSIVLEGIETVGDIIFGEKFSRSRSKQSAGVSLGYVCTSVFSVASDFSTKEAMLRLNEFSAFTGIARVTAERRRVRTPSEGAREEAGLKGDGIMGLGEG